jgi:hypothetical protein
MHATNNNKWQHLIEVLDRTNISTADKITFANSPIHLRIQNVAKKYHSIGSSLFMDLERKPKQ